MNVDKEINKKPIHSIFSNIDKLINEVNEITDEIKFTAEIEKRSQRK